MSTTAATPTSRGEVLMEAKSLTEGDRNQQHGDPYENLAMAAAALNAVLSGKLKEDLDAADVGIIYTLLKIVRRYAGDPNNRDTYVDSCAYMAMAWECQETIDANFGPTYLSKGGIPVTDADIIHGSNRRGTDVGITGRAGIFPETDSRAVKRRSTDPGYRDADITHGSNRRGIDLGVTRREGYAMAGQVDRRHDDPGEKNGSTSGEGADQGGRKVPRRPAAEDIPPFRK